MSDRDPWQLELDEEMVDRALLEWLRRNGMQVTTVAEGVEKLVDGFNLKTLMQDEFGDDFAGDGKLGPLSTSLERFGYWLFVGGGQPKVRYPKPLWLKTVTIRATRREVAFERRAVLSVLDAAMTPVPAVPEGLLPTTGPWNFARSREALLEFAAECVQRVNVVVPAALHLRALSSE